MRFIPYFLSLALSLCAPLGCAIFVDGNGKISEQNISLDNFQALYVDFTFQVTAQSNATYSVLARIDENIWPFLDIKKSDAKTLYLGRKSTIFSNAPKGNLQAILTMPSLSSVEVTGGSKVTLGSFPQTETLTLKIHSSSEFSATSLSANTAQIDVSGGSRLNLAGGMISLTLNGSGKSTLDLNGLTAQRAEITLSGESQIANLHIADNGSLRVRLSGASTLRYKGSPAVEILEQSGNSQIVQE